MDTVILKWNPAFSSYSMLHYLSDIHDLNLYGVFDYNWSVWDHDKINDGDRFYWLKVGLYGQIGIVGCGVIISDPYESDDWSGKGRQTFYVDLEAETLINPDALPILTAEELAKAIPDFEWTGGHSGVVLEEAQAAKLNELWDNFMHTHAEEFAKAKSLGRGDDDLIYIEQQD